MTPTVAVTLTSGVGDIILGSDLVGSLILTIITILSVVSWAITAEKLLQFRKSRRETKRFLRLLPREFSIFEARHYTHGLKRSTLAALLSEAAASVAKDTSGAKNAKDVSAAAIAKSAKAAMERASLGANDRMEGRLIFLATTASASPLLGLFGTVWGVMESFINMGRMGSASLSVVGPGVAVALITTVFGLAAAIPALVAYNYFVNRIRGELSDMQSFVSLVADSIEREIQSELDASKISV